MGLKSGHGCVDTKFMGSANDYEKAGIILVGAPMDLTTSFRPGTRFGPQKIREMSVGLEEYSVYQDCSLANVPYYDCGDLELVPGDIDSCMKSIGEAADQIISDSKFPLFMGGEHTVSVPVVDAFYKKYGEELVIIQMDAHADLRIDYLGFDKSHASAIRLMTGFVPGKNIYQLGIRSGTREEFSHALQHTNLYKYHVLKPLREITAEIGNRPVYVTLDIDVVDPAFANGTGTPEPGGISSGEAIDSILHLSNLNLAGFDIVEVSPPYDASGRTALLAAKIIREVILAAGSQRG